MVERIIRVIIQRAIMKEGMIWDTTEPYNEYVSIRRGNNSFKVYINTAETVVIPQKVEKFIEKIKQDLEKQFEIIDEKTLNGFKVITLNLK